MSDHEHDNGPLFSSELTPEHRPTFWADLDASLSTQTAEMTRPMERVGERAEEAAADRTEQMPRVARLPRRDRQDVRSSRSRRTWPLAAAAAVLAILGVGFLVLRDPQTPGTTTEIVSGTTTDSDAAPLDGPDDDSNDSATDEATSNEPDADADDDDGLSAEGGGDNAGGEDDPTATTSGTAADPTPVAGPPIPDFAPAAGAEDVDRFLPLDQGLPEHATFLGTWADGAVSYYAVSATDASCEEADYAQIRAVNGSGITQDVRDPQLRFSGEISHFAVQSGVRRAAWVVACGTQLELYVATLNSVGHVDTSQLVWIGEGSTSTALVLWDGDEVNFNAIAPDGKFFAIAYGTESELLSRNGGPSRIMLEAGAPGQRSLTPLAASPDGGLLYFTGRAPAGTVSECPELFGSGVSDTLWLRQGEGQWLLAMAGDRPLATVTAAAIESEFNQFALADVCEGKPGRVLVGDQLPDGRIGDTREIDLTPFVPGFVSQLHWIDADTLRIETDNSRNGFGIVRFDYRLDEGIILQLD